MHSAGEHPGPTNPIAAALSLTKFSLKFIFDDVNGIPQSTTTDPNDADWNPGGPQFRTTD
jgi:hypothetical protein